MRYLSLRHADIAFLLRSFTLTSGLGQGSGDICVTQRHLLMIEVPQDVCCQDKRAAVAEGISCSLLPPRNKPDTS
ncbi:hypothetical protein CERZMDRAFT_91015 [Cercospora zeae-maydis SCOH1-5]|uniref:Uncharacterized protein n=1 Tax=Cercospora zeae-maydis SCOH1-5 TaxID=717836 RepID=A0A6A6FC23_9PEZI|nr:hypothetical protein CERZMDRAFT_91015 [Cercospora zeae-maydis SCOH1-5]